MRSVSFIRATSLGSMHLLLIPGDPRTRCLLVLTDVSPADALQLIDRIRGLSSLEAEPVVLASARNGDEPLSLIARATSRDNGCHRVTDQDGRRAIHCDLTPITWDQVADLMEPFSLAVAGHAHQYLNHDGEMEWIVSTDRSW